jgi:hypothetical protein
MNLKKIIKKITNNDWETVHTTHSEIEWRDLGTTDILAYYHIQYSKIRNRYRIKIEKCKGGNTSHKDPKNHPHYAVILSEVTKANKELMDEEGKKEEKWEERNKSIDSLLK